MWRDRQRVMRAVPLCVVTIRFCLEEFRMGNHPVWNLLAVKASHLKALQLLREFGLEPFRAHEEG